MSAKKKNAGPGRPAMAKPKKRVQKTLTLDPVILQQAEGKYGRRLGRRIDDLLRKDLLGAI